MNGKLKPAVLDDAGLARVRQLEAEIGDGVVVIAYAKITEPAELSNNKLAKLQQLEQQLGHVYLIAWKKPESVA